jgi:titin
VGTNAGGNAAVANGQYGIAISDFIGFGTASNNTIGGAAAGTGNLISGNTSGGVAILETLTPVTGNVLQGNLIGTDVTGLSALANQGPGVTIAAADNTIGGTAAAAGNVISGNLSVGVEIEFSVSTGNLVAGNLIGVNKNGNLALPNAADGVILNNAPNNFIGSSAPGAAPNIISGQARSGIEILGSNATGNTVSNNYVGTDITGTVAIPNGPNHALAYAGIFVESGNNTVGGTVAGAGNLVSGNFGDAGILIQTSAVSGAADANLVAGNLIGTDKTGLVALGNQNNGIDLQSANNTIGGTVAAARNIIAASGNVGIAFEVNGAVPGSSHNNLIEGNYISLGSDGSTVLGNARNGVDIFDDSGSNTIGGTAAGAANVISGNGLYGVFVNTPNNVVESNLIGTDASGAKAKGNAIAGIFVDSATNSIGGTVAGAANVVSGNGLEGLVVSGSTATQNIVLGNFIGTEVGGTLPLGNGQYGILILGGATLTAVGDGQLAANHANVISDNLQTQIRISGAGTNTNIVAGDFIGTDPTGSFAVGGIGNGIVIAAGASNNIIGANKLTQSIPPSNRRNIISGLGGPGVLITDPGTTGNIVGGAYVGVAADGNSTLANMGDGIDILAGASGNLIGSDGDGVDDNLEPNVISGNHDAGVFIGGLGTTSNRVSGNFIGTNAGGTAVVGGNFIGGVIIRTGASDNLIGVDITQTASASTPLTTPSGGRRAQLATSSRATTPSASTFSSSPPREMSSRVISSARTSPAPWLWGTL